MCPLCVLFVPLLGWKEHSYATTKQLEKNVFTINSQNINQEICIQVTFSLEIKLQKYIFFAKYDHFLTANVPFSNHYYDRNVHMYAMTKEVRRHAFNAKGENIKQTSAIQVTFI